MSEQAQVSSIDALESFRASLIVFLDKAHRCLDEISDEIRRTRVWVQQDQRHHWDQEIRKRQRALDAAEQELFAARLSNLRDDLRVQQEAVRKAKMAVREGEEKMRNLKMWTRDFSHRVDPLGRRLEGMRQYLDFDMPKALAFLLKAQQTLDAYAETRAPTAKPGQPTAGTDAPTDAKPPQ